MGLSIGWDEYLGLVLNQISITTLSLYGKVQENNVGVGLANQMYTASTMIYRICIRDLLCFSLHSHERIRFWVSDG